jgi:cell fate (sporulation/competence/biofilm development) regulator YmcA (YheA/YmcA/DUF963 family)
MSMLMSERPQLMEKANLIADMVARSLEMSIFKQAEQDLRTDERAQSLLQEVQAKQTSGEDVEPLLDQLEGLDVVRRFTIAQEGVSEVVSHVTKILAAVVSDRVDLVTPKEGCGCCTADMCPSAGTCDDATAALCGGAPAPSSCGM